MKVDEPTFDVSKVADPDVAPHVANYLRQLHGAIQSHIDAEKVYRVTTPAAANTEFAVAHSLGKKPSNFLLVDRDANGSLYRSSRAWTEKFAYFKFSAASAKIGVLVW